MAETKNPDLRDTSRLETFSDGVFAIAITLLILEIHVPSAKENETLFNTLLQEWPSFLALLIGFFTLLICWINHNYMFSMIEKGNSVLSLINGFKLLVVTFTPFATALLSKNIQSSWEKSSTTLYAFNFACMGFAMTAIWLYATKKGFVHTHSSKKLKAITRLYITASVLSTIIWLVSYFSVLASFILFLLMFAIFVFPEKIVAWQGAMNK